MKSNVRYVSGRIIDMSGINHDAKSVFCRITYAEKLLQLTVNELIE